MCHYSELVDWETFNEQFVAGEADSTEPGVEPSHEDPTAEGLDPTDPVETVAPSTDD